MAKKTKRAAKPKGHLKIPAADEPVGKRIQFDRATWDAIALLARELMKDIPEITEEAFCDLLKKYGRSADLREALKLSTRRGKK